MLASLALFSTPYTNHDSSTCPSFLLVPLPFSSPRSPLLSISVAINSIVLRFFVRNTLRSRCSKLFFALRCFERNHSLLLRLCSRFAWFLHIDKNISGKNNDAMVVIPCTHEGVRFSCRIVRMLTQQARARKHSLGQEAFLVYETLLRRHTFDLFLAIVFFCLLARLKISRISKPLILLSQLYDFYNANNYSSDCFRPVTRANDYRSNKGFIHCE